MEIITPANTGLVIVLRIHIECDFSLICFFFAFFPPFIINHPETVNYGNCLFVFTFMGDFGRELSFKRTTRR